MILKLIIILKNNKDSDLLQNLHFCSKKTSKMHWPKSPAKCCCFKKLKKNAAVREAGQILVTHKIRLILLLLFHKKVGLKTICFT